MKLSFGILLLSTPGFGQSDYEDLANKNKKCKGLRTPKSCADCEKNAKCIKSAGFTDVCTTLTFLPTNRCIDGECQADDPTTCAECVEMGRDCVKQGEFGEVCEDLGWSSKKNVCVEGCPARPTTCADCITHEERIKECKFKPVCKEFGFSRSTCPVACDSEVPTTCEDCITLGKGCIAEGGFKDTCLKLGFTKKETCVEACPTPEKCEDCVTHITRIKECKLKPTCKEFGFNGRSCPEECPAEPTTCAECLTHQDRIKECKFKPVCVGLGFDGKKCNTPCPTDEPTECQSCIDMGVKCVKSGQHKQTCSAFGFVSKRGSLTCETPCSKNIPATCADCIEMGATCVKKNGHKKTCSKFGYLPQTNTCKDVVVCAEESPATCADCIAMGATCVKKNGHKKTCSKFGYLPQTNTCKDVVVCAEELPATCADCLALDKSCIKGDKAIAQACKKLNFKKGRCRDA